MLTNKLSHNNVKVRFVFTMAFAFVAALAITGFSVNVNAATFVVNTTNDTADAAPGNGACADAAGACSLRAAISEANALAGADIITLPAGTYTHSLVSANENANAGGDFDILAPLTINGAGAATTIIQANAVTGVATERVMHIASNNATAVTIDGVTLQNGWAKSAADGQGRGGGIKVAGDVNTDGVGINFTFTNSTVKDNRADTRGGGLAINYGNMTVTGCTFTGNNAGDPTQSVAGGAGGAIIVDAQDNQAATAMTVVFNNTVISNNKAETALTNSFGGGVIVRASDSSVTFNNCTINNNLSRASTSPSFRGFAGGLYNQNARMVLRDSTVSGNTSSDFHCGIRVLSSPIPGGFGADVTLDVTNSTVSNNTCTDAGGQGGGITNILGAAFNSTVNIDHSTISGNILPGATSIAGGLLNTGSAGGAALMQITNSTISGNSAADIGGVYSDGSAATCIIDFSTIANNSATNTTNPQGGGVFQDTTAGGSTFMSNSISANNVAGIDVDVNDLVSSLDYNHIENPNPAFVPGANDVIGTDPNIGTLANNGGPTLTHRPNAGSPVINTIPNGTAGCGNPINDDQRGLPRPFPAGGLCDKGSVEEQPVGPTATNTSTPIGPTNTNTSTPMNTATNTPTNTPTQGPTSTNTNTPISTPTNTNTSTPTNTPTQGPTSTNTNTPINTPTRTNTSTPTSTATFTSTPTATATFTPTSAPSGSPTPVAFPNATPICSTLGTVAAPYPSTITVVGGPTQIGNMRVVFRNFWHVLPDNFDALLVGPNGAEYVVMGDAGGAISINQNTPVTLTFADFQPLVLPDSGPLVTGTTEPTTWESPVSNFAAPAPPGPYIEAGSVPFGPINTTMRGAFGFSNSNGVWSLYIRDDAGGFNTPQQITGCLDGGWELQFLPLTAAQSSISGRVTTADGHGIRNAKVLITGNSLTTPIVATTGSLGWYSVDGLASGETYVVTVNSQRYTFSTPTRVISLVDNVVDADFTANPQE